MILRLLLHYTMQASMGTPQQKFGSKQATPEVRKQEGKGYIKEARNHILAREEQEPSPHKRTPTCILTDYAEVTYIKQQLQ